MAVPAKMNAILVFNILSETSDTHSDDGVVLGVWLPGATSDLLVGTGTMPDTDSGSFESGGTTEG